MKFVIFGLTISSSWGNGHATLWRGLCRALGARGHSITFFERDVPYYAEQRDCAWLPDVTLRLYPEWDQATSAAAAAALHNADVAIVTSFCPDGPAAARLALDSRAALKVFYDLDTPVTLGELEQGRRPFYLPASGLGDFDLVLSFTGGPALELLRTRLGARRVAPLYGSVDPEVHLPVAALDRFRADLSYMGTYSDDRQAVLEQLLIEPARELPDRRFMIGGAQYPGEFPWAANIWFVHHLPPAEHAAFFCSSRLTLNITRSAMARLGYCPSGRLFEAAACGAALLSDAWPGLEQFFEPGRELLVARSSADVVAALRMSDEELRRIGRAARERVLSECTAAGRAAELERLCTSAAVAAAPVLAGGC